MTLIKVDISKSPSIILKLDDEKSPQTVKQFVSCLPFSVKLNLWGEEIYTNESPINIAEENPESPVELFDVAYWPTGKAICLFYGPTPIGKKGEITPASPVNVIGKIISPDKTILKNIDGKTATFQLS